MIIFMIPLGVGGVVELAGSKRLIDRAGKGIGWGYGAWTAIFAVVGLYQYIVAIAQLGPQLAGLVDAANLGKHGFLAFTTLFFLLMGAVLDAIPVMLIFFPVLLPIALELGIDPTHFGVIVVLNLMIGLLTPPIGVLLFLQTKIANITFGELLGEIWPYTLALIGLLLLVTYVPQLVLFIPNLVF
jgi:TRAP-type C4-dicarboxylate transport system permease large subunit